MGEGSLDRIEELLAEALERPAEERSSFLERACGDDLGLRREVEELLGLHEDAAGYFDELSGDIAAAAPLELESAAQPRVDIGPYRTIAAVGRGGMGAVYRAERVDGAFDQEVALKLLHRDMDTPQLRARFLAERQLLARLSHPHIAHLQDGGVTDEGRPFFAMEFVEGVPITCYCEDSELPIDKVLRLFLDVIDAVSYLHRNLVVHRDLKPSNIFVDRDGQVKLLDFGIAKLLAHETDGGGQTRTGERLMTPEYAAPEQLLGDPVTTATDVYALGVVLYELLTGRRPHDRAGAERGSVARDLPPTPSSMLRSQTRRVDAAPTGASGVRGAAGEWRRIAGDLDTICLMALRPEAEARYQSAEQLGQDIERHLEGLPVRARKSTLGYRLGKAVRRQRRGLLVTAVLLAMVVAGFVHERGLRDEAEQARAEAVAVSEFLGELLSSIDPKKAQGREVTVAEVLDEAAAGIADSLELTRQPQVEASVRLTIGNTYRSLGKYAEAREHLERAVELSGGPDARDPGALDALASLGVVYQSLGLLDEAEPLLRKVLEVRVETLGEEHPDSLTALNLIANLLWSEGRFEEVEAIDRKTLEIRRRVLGEDHPDTLTSLNALAASLFNRGAYAEAAQLFEQGLAARRRQLGEDHPDTLTFANNLAAAYLELGRQSEAETLLREIVSGRTRVLGAEHLETVMSVHNLGVTLAQRARYEEAGRVLEGVVASREKMPGDRRGYLFSRSYLADVYRDQGSLEKAEDLYLSTLELLREEYGSDDEHVLRTITGLAGLRLKQGDLEGAEALIDEILDSQLRVRGEEHPDTLGSLTILAEIRVEQGRFTQAYELSQRVVETGSGALGIDHPVVLAAAFVQARALVGQQKLPAARELAGRVYEARVKVLGEDHPSTAEALTLLEDLS